jgi:hypothetical protein
MNASIELDAERSALLERRHHLQQDLKRIKIRTSYDQDENKRLQETIVAYNSVMDSIHGLDRSLRVDPMDKLPPELLGNILKECTSLDGDFYRYPFPVCKALILTLVSKRWRSFILSEPMFWDTIVLLRDFEDTETYFRLSISLSGRLPLHIHVGCCFSDWQLVVPCLSDHRERIKTLSLGHLWTAHRCTREEQHILDILRQMPPMPGLRQLDVSMKISHTVNNLNIILRNFPLLTHLYGVCFCPENLSEKTELQEIHAVCHLYNILKANKNFQRLKVMKFVNPAGRWNVDYSREAEAYLENHQFLLPWTSLEFPRAALLIPLLHRLPMLTVLSVSVGIVTFTKAISIINRFQFLKKFDVELTLFYQDPTTEIACLSQLSGTSPNTSVDALKLEIIHRKEHPPEVHEKYLIICQILISIMPKVKNVELRSWSPYFLLRCLEDLQFPLLEGVHLICWDEIIPFTKVQLPGGVRRLRVRCPGDIIPCLSNTSSIRHLSWEKNGTPAVVNQLDVTYWSSLETLEAPCVQIRWNLGSLQNIRTIVFYKDTKYNHDIIEENANVLLKLLASEPEECPFLEKIHFTQCPEWDLLFILLQRRNILHAPHATPISNLVFHSKPPLLVQNLIRQLLKGRYPDMPPLRDLSLAGNAEIMLDREM